MSRKALFTESTRVPARRSIADIQQLLVHAGARSIHFEYCDSQDITALSFTIPYGNAFIPYKLPARVDQVMEKINGSRVHIGRREQFVERDKLQAERVAWRQLYWWLKAQLALIELGMAKPEEVLMPYRLDDSGQTMFEFYRDHTLLKLLPQNGE